MYLPYIGAISVPGAFFGQGSSTIFLIYSCAGEENSLSECGYVAAELNQQCSHERDVGVICSGKLQDGYCNGMSINNHCIFHLQVTVVIEPFGWLVVEMSLRVVWRSAMEDSGEQYATVGGMTVMLQLYAGNLDSLKGVIKVNNMAALFAHACTYSYRYPAFCSDVFASQFGAVFGQGRGPIYRVDCRGSESHISQCTCSPCTYHNCYVYSNGNRYADHSKDAGVFCPGRY